MTPVISLLSDFGLRDPYVGEMKARILGLVPDARVVDLTHEIPAGDVAAGAFLLSRAWSAFGSGSVHLAIVDPGVGSSRPALAVRAADHWFVGPDNGLLSLAAALPDVVYRLDPERVVSGERLSATFHGRDLFAPAAARIALGEDPSRFAVAAPSMVGLEPMIETIDGSLFGEVLWIDRFGNAITAMREEQVRNLGPSVEVRVAGLRVRELHSTFADVEALTPLAYIGSAGTLELAVRDGDLSERFGVYRGARVEVRPARKD